MIVLFFFLFLSGCASISEMDGDGDESFEVTDEVGQLLSDIQQEQDEMFSGVEEPQAEASLELSEEKLEPTPTEKYDSTVLENKEETLVPDPIFNNDEETKPNKAFENYQSTISKLSINDKIQYRVATINFYSGSSNVDVTGLRKIKKIAKIAKERNARIKIVGHASKRTRDMPLAKHKIVNFKISDKRAQSVADIFIKKYSFPSDALITEAVSDTKPLFKENMPAGTRANQRTEIFLIY